MRQRYAYDANESTRRLVEGGMSTGLTNMPTARGFSVLYHVFITLKQCILCSALRHKSYLTLLCVISIRDFFCLGTFTQGSIWLPPRTLASSRGCSLVINMLTVSSDVSMQGRHWQPLTVHLWAYCNPPIAHDKMMRDAWKVDHTAGKTSPAAIHFEQYECEFFYIPFDLTNERPQSNVTAQWRDHHDLKWDKVSNHSQNYLTSFFKRPLLLVRPTVRLGFKTNNNNNNNNFILCIKNKSWLWFAPQIAGWQIFGKSGEIRVIRDGCTRERVEYYPVSRGPSIFLDKSIDGPLLLG